MSKLNFKFFKKSKTEIIEPPLKTKQIQFGKYFLTTDLDHPLSIYLEEFPLYDQFLPQICSNFSGLIIDVGANIGDTLLSVFEKNDESFLIAVEPDDEFAENCLLNIEQNNLPKRVLLVKKFISSKKGNFVIEKNKSASTGSIKEDKDLENSNSLSFSELMDLIPYERKQNLDIIKIDTDGFDWDILNSYSEMVNSKPENKFRFIYFEFQNFLNNENNSMSERQDKDEKYKKALENLLKTGYDTFTVFDNFGTKLITTKTISEILVFSDYITRSKIYNNYSTIYHLDILVYNSIETEFVNEQLKLYLEKN